MNIAHYIDHTLLKPNATINQVRELCQQAIEHKFYSVCVNSCHVARCKYDLANTEVKVCSVIGFPLGASSASNKLNEAITAISDGANELDMVINIGYLLCNYERDFSKEIKDIVQYSHQRRVLVKVIIETALLTDDQKRLACRLAFKAETDFVKTCTGFNGGQATIEDIKLMRLAVHNQVLVKASGGIRDYVTALAMIEAGASRIGTSSGIKIVQEEQEALAKE